MTNKSLEGPARGLRPLDEAVERLRDVCRFPYDHDVRLDDLRAILDAYEAATRELRGRADAYAALRDERDDLRRESATRLAAYETEVALRIRCREELDALHARLKAAERVVSAAHRHLTKFWADEGQVHQEPLEALDRTVTEYRERFGGRDE